jgi:hypothetical protein
MGMKEAATGASVEITCNRPHGVTSHHPKFTEIRCDYIPTIMSNIPQEYSNRV